MIASTVLLDVHTALWTWLGSHSLDSPFRQIVLRLLRLVTPTFPVRRPWAIALQANFVFTVGAGNPLFAVLGVLAVFDGEVSAALGRKTGDV